MTAEAWNTGVNGPSDTFIIAYQENGTTIISSNDDAEDEPLSGMNRSVPGVGHGLSRTCFIAPADAHVLFRLYTPDPAAASYTGRVVETTSFSNWFFVGADYHAYTLLRNTTNVTLDYTIRWRNASGTELATFTGSLPANGSFFKDGRDFAAVLGAVSGTVEVVHNRSPEALVASTTVLSATTGLSFDAPFMKRVPW